MEEGRQREQDELYRGDHEGGRQEVPSGQGGAEEVSSSWLLWLERADWSLGGQNPRFRDERDD